MHTDTAEADFLNEGIEIIEDEEEEEALEESNLLKAELKRMEEDGHHAPASAAVRVQGTEEFEG